MKIGATVRGAARIGKTLLWFGVGIFGPTAIYLLTLAPPSQAVSDQKAWREDEAICVESGFPVGTPENFSCIIDLRGARNYPIEMGTEFP